MKYDISNVQVIPIREANGLVGFASLILNEGIYLGSIGIHTLAQGGYRLVYPTRKSGATNFPVFYPINRETAQQLEIAVLQKFHQVTHMPIQESRPLLHAA